MAGLTWVSVANAPPIAAHLARVFDLAAYRFLEVGVTAWEFARAKLRRDPIYRAALAELPQSGTTLVDVGCGQGLTLAVLVEATAAANHGDWPREAPPPPHFDRLIGIETRARVAAMARRALADGADIIHDAAPGGLPAQITAALVFDVLHLMSRHDQERLVTELRARLEPGGMVLVRDVDAAAGPGFHAVRLGNRLKNLAVGQFRQRFHFRTAAEWTALFARAGWTVERSPMGHGTPFANVLFKLT
jgi:SAM-dependent methyltransferase